MKRRKYNPKFRFQKLPKKRLPKKYRNKKDYWIKTKVTGHFVVDPFGRFTLFKEGWLCINEGVEWDGATCAFDIFMREASLVHDVFCWMFELNLLSDKYRSYANRLLVKIMRHNSPWYLWFRGCWVFAGTQLGAARNTITITAGKATGHEDGRNGIRNARRY